MKVLLLGIASSLLSAAAVLLAQLPCFVFFGQAKMPEQLRTLKK